MSDIQQLLEDAQVDFRDCYEKSELVSRLQNDSYRLPEHVQTRLKTLLYEANDGQVDPFSPLPELDPDEDKVVKLFNVVCLVVVSYLICVFLVVST